MSWPAVPRVVATIASPHESRSCLGWYMPEAAGRPRPREVKAPFERSLDVRMALLLL